MEFDEEKADEGTEIAKRSRQWYRKEKPFYISS